MSKTNVVGNKSEVQNVIERYKDMVYRIALVRVKNPWDAEDVFQEVFLTYYRKNLVFQEEEHRKAWLIRTTMNLAKKSTGSLWKRKVDVVENVENSQRAFSTDTLFKEDEENELFHAMRQLPEKDQTVLYLFYFEDLSTKEIAGVTGIREGTVRMRLSRAREKMKELLVKAR